MKHVVMTPAEGKKLIDGIDAKLKEYALGHVVNTEELSALNLRDAGQLIREAVLEYEDDRLAAGRKGKVAAPPVVEKKA